MFVTFIYCLLIKENFQLHKYIVITSKSYFNAVGNAVVLVMFTTSVSWTLFASVLFQGKIKLKSELGKFMCVCEKVCILSH